MSFFTKVRNAVTGVVGGAVGGLTGMMGGGAMGGMGGGLPQPNQAQGMTSSGDMGYQNSIGNLMNMTGQTPIQPTNVGGGGLI